MFTSEPKVRLVSRPQLILDPIVHFLHSQGASVEAIDRLLGSGLPDAEKLMEFAGRMCYKSYEPGLNPNVTKIREDSTKYLQNVVASLHGSVLEHAQFVFVFENVSRVFTHELARHRAGTTISQESLRYVRLTEMGIPQPQWALDDPALQERVSELVRHAENLQTWMGDHFGIDDEGVDFSKKKAYTSYMRRFAPDGIGTTVTWGANVRSLRHVLEMRTAHGAEEEIRRVFDQVGYILRDELPSIMADFARTDDGAWVPQYRKV